MAKSITDIKRELGITSSSTIDYLFTLASQYKVFSQAEINNIKAISVLPLANSVRDKADELKQRFTDIVLNENKGQIHGINVRIVIILELLEKLNTLAEKLSEDKADKDDVYDKDNTYNKTEIDGALNLKADKTDTYTKSEVYNKTETDNLLDLKADKSTTYTKTESDILLNEKANKSNTYTKSEVNTALDAKADKTNTYTKSQVDTALNDKVNTSDFDTLDGRVDDIEDDIDTLKSVQNVVDVVATYAALQSYVTTNLDANDKVQVIADETHSGASTIYNWNGSAWQYVGAYGGNTYTKTQTDTLLDGKADKSTTYTKTETDTLLNNKADKSTTYTKTETDTLLNTKANKSTTYTKAEIDTILNTIVIEKYLESSDVPPITIRGYVTQEVFNSIGPRTQVQLRVYDSNNDMTFILTQNSPGTDGYGFKCTFNSPLTTDGMIEVDGAIYEDREYIFDIRLYRIYTEDEVDTLLSSKQDVLQAGEGITISGNVISTTSGGGSGTTVVANPTLAGTEADLTGLEVDGTKYKVSSGSGGGSSTPLLEDIVDSAGNKRFVEGEATPETISGFTFSYNKWSLSGTHLMMVCAGTVDSANLISGLTICTYENIPDYIMNKIVALWFNGTTVDVKTVYFRSLEDSSGTSVNIRLVKENNNLYVKCYASQAITNVGFRIQFDLLIDADYSE